MRLALLRRVHPRLAACSPGSASELTLSRVAAAQSRPS